MRLTIALVAVMLSACASSGDPARDQAINNAAIQFGAALNQLGSPQSNGLRCQTFALGNTVQTNCN